MGSKHIDHTTNKNNETTRETSLHTTTTATHTIIKYVIMKTVTTLFCLSTIAGIASAATELSVKVYEGPTECEDSDKIKPGDYVNMHYKGSIDESSETGEKGFVFENSRDHTPFLFQIGNGAALKGRFQFMLFNG